MNKTNKLKLILLIFVIILQFIISFNYVNGIDLLINYSNPIGFIYNYTYGINTHGIWGSNESWFDSNGDGVLDVKSNYSWHRELLNDANIRFIRADMYLDKVFQKIPNLDAELWINNSLNFNESNYDLLNTIPFFWYIAINNESGGSATISRSSDSHSGLYSTNISNNGSGGAFIYQNLDLPSGHIYNFSVWMKSNSSSNFITIQRKDNYNSMRKYSSGNNDWELLSIGLNVTDYVSKGWRINIETVSGTELLWDDAIFLEDDIEFSNWLTKNVSNDQNINLHKNLLEWASSNNIKILYIANYMPNYLANVTSHCLSDISKCSPKNYSEFGKLITTFIDEVTSNGSYENNIEIEIWNEPDVLDFWLPDISIDDSIRSTVYNDMYKNSKDEINSIYPIIKVGGPALGDLDSQIPVYNNFNGSIDFFSFHHYLYSSQHFDNILNIKYNNLMNNCSLKNWNCSKIQLNEFNLGNSDDLINNTPKLKLEIATAYAYSLNRFCENISFALFQWTEAIPFSAGEGIYPSYPKRYSLVEEETKEVYILYNLTKQFSTYHGAGDIIYKTNSTSNDISAISTKQNNSYFITIMNKNNSIINVSLNIDGINFSKLRNVYTNVNFTNEGGIVQINSLDNYSVETFEIILNELVLEDLTSCMEMNITFNNTAQINLSQCFSDPMNQTINFTAEGNSSITVAIENSLLSLAGSAAQENITIIAQGTYGRRANATIQAIALNTTISNCSLQNKSFPEDTAETYSLDCFSGTATADGNNSVKITISGPTATLTPDPNWFGTEYIRFYTQTATSNNLTITVTPMPDCGDSTCEGVETCSNCPSDCGVCSSGGGGSGGIVKKEIKNITINLTIPEINETNPEITIPEINETINQTLNITINETIPEINQTIPETKEITPTLESPKYTPLAVQFFILIIAIIILAIAIIKIPKSLQYEIAKRKHLPEEKIKKELLAKGFTEIDKNLESHKELKNYIEKNKTHPELENHLINAGWEKETIRMMMK